MKRLLSDHRALVIVVILAALLTALPQIQSWMMSEGEWQGIPLVYGDELIYYTQMKEIATGNVFFGNPYYLEHRHDLPLTVLGSSILAAVPMLLGLPLFPTLALNFLVWGVLFVVLVYWLLRELSLPKWLAACTGLFAYVQSYDLIFRASVRQEIYPFLILFYIAFVRFLKASTVRSAVFLGIASGISFYIYGFLWQTVVVTLGFHFLYLLAKRSWSTLRIAFIAYGVAGIIGAPPFLYTLWITHHPLFWESVRRFGVVDTHLPMGEVVYSGGWVGVALILLALAYVCIRTFRESAQGKYIALFIGISGVALWVLQASNIITGTHFEIGEHMRRFIIPWLALAAACVGWILWRGRHEYSMPMRGVAILLLCALIGANVWFGYKSAFRFLPNTENDVEWRDTQLYHGPLSWLEEHEPEPVVVWGDPHNQSTVYIPVLTKHYVLHEEFGKLVLLSDAEFQERYLVSQYFERPDADDLKGDLAQFLGRAATFHEPKTIEREIKVCRIVRIVLPGPDCGVPPTAVSLLGEPFFEGLADRLEQDIRPNIQEYLQRYHVRYIIKDIERDREYRPERLGAQKVYDDGRFSLYRLPE